MRLNLFITTVGTGGSGQYAYLFQFLQKQLAQAGFTSGFDEFKLTLMYPPSFVRPEISLLQEGFNERYHQLPKVRTNRKFKSIDIILQAPQIAGYFENPFKDADVAPVLIDKFLEAVALLKPRLKPEDVFNVGIFETVLNDAKQKLTPDFLQQLSATTSADNSEQHLKDAYAKRAERKANVQIVDTLIRDIRLYFTYQLSQSLFYLNRYTELVCSYLRQNDFKCPGYHHLYISVADTEEMALSESIIIEGWFTYGIAVLKEQTLLNAQPSQQQELYLNAVKEGLLDIADLDHLDKIKILEAVAFAKENGAVSEVVYKSKDNKKIEFTISLKPVIEKNEDEIFFTIIDKTTHRIARWKFGQENSYAISLWLAFINVTNKKITIRSRAYTQLALAGKPLIIELDVERELALHEVAKPIA